MSDGISREEIERAAATGPPDFLLGDDFDAENGAGASDELMRLGKENTVAERTPEERLEDLRFFVVEGDANFKPHLSRWMQEVERQLGALRVAALDAHLRGPT